MVTAQNTTQVNLLSDHIYVSSSTKKGVKIYHILGNEFAGIHEEVTPDGQIIKRAIIGVPWSIGKTNDSKKARAYVKKCREMGDIVTLDLPKSARGLQE